jgi:hypothetical protein
MAEGIRSKQADYQYALEGVGFAQQVIANKKAQLDETVRMLNNPEVMGGETGKEYCKRLQEAVEVVDAVLKKYNAFANKVAEICKENGAFLNDTVMADFDAVQKLFAAKADEIAKFNGQRAVN